MYREEYKERVLAHPGCQSARLYIDRATMRGDGRPQPNLSGIVLTEEASMEIDVKGAARSRPIACPRGERRRGSWRLFPRNRFGSVDEKGFPDRNGDAWGKGGLSGCWSVDMLHKSNVLISV